MKMINDNLTEHEMNILKLLAKGYSNRSIAENVYITERTVWNHIHRIGQKLGVSGKVNILRQALINGLLDVQDLRRSPNE